MRPRRKVHRYAMGGRPRDELVGRSNPNPTLLPGGSTSNRPGTGTTNAGSSTKQNSSQPRGSELSELDYLNYGFGPEHNFFGTRAIPEVGSFITQQSAKAPKTGKAKDYNNYLLAALGLMVGNDIYKYLRDKDGNIPTNLNLDDLHAQASDTSSLNQWAEEYLSGLQAPVLADFEDSDRADFLARLDAAARDTSRLDAEGQEYLSSLSAPELSIDPSLWDYLKGIGQGGMGALGVYGGLQEGGAGGYGTALEGAGDIADVLGYSGVSSGLGSAGNVLTGIDEGGVRGGIKAGAGALDLANQVGVDTGAVGSYLGPVGSLYGAYEGIQRGDPQGYANAAAGLYQAGVATGAIAPAASTGAMAAGSGAAGAMGALGTVAPLAAAGFAIADILNSSFLGHDKHKVEGAKTEAVYNWLKENPQFGITFEHKGRGGAYMVLPNGQKVRFIGGTDPLAEKIRSAILNGDMETFYSLIGYKKAHGGLARFAEGGLNSMIPRRGGLSMMRSSMTSEDPSSYYRYGAPPNPAPQMSPQMPVRRAMGGGLMMGYNQGGSPGMPRLVRGPGSGRSDDIPARLSDGEYVFDAETVALLGDGSTDEGARRLDALRRKLRMHKGKQLSRGRFSSAAKNPEDYLE